VYIAPFLLLGCSQLQSGAEGMHPLATSDAFEVCTLGSTVPVHSAVILARIEDQNKKLSLYMRMVL
jgi:hypothetical protein